MFHDRGGTFVIACVVLASGPWLPITSSIASEPLAKGIQDNLFFIEEAYNQEPGVVQHIFNLPIDFTNGAREIGPEFYLGMAGLQSDTPILVHDSVRLYGRRQRDGRHAAQLPFAGIYRRQVYASVR